MTSMQTSRTCIAPSQPPPNSAASSFSEKITWKGSTIAVYSTSASVKRSHAVRKRENGRTTHLSSSAVKSSVRKESSEKRVADSVMSSGIIDCSHSASSASIPSETRRPAAPESRKLESFFSERRVLGLRFWRLRLRACFE